MFDLRNMQDRGDSVFTFVGSPPLSCLTSDTNWGTNPCCEVVLNRNSFFNPLRELHLPKAQPQGTLISEQVK